MSSTSGVNRALAATRTRWMSSSEQICGRSSNRPSAPLSGISTSTTRPTNVIAGSWPTLMMIRSAAVPASDHEHPSSRERVQEVAQEHAPDGDDHDADDDRRHELGGVGLGHAEETVEERADGQGQDAATADAEAELAHLEEGARLEATARGPVDAADGQGDHDRHREERVNGEVVDQIRPIVHLQGGDVGEDDQRKRQGDAGADEVDADLHERELAIRDTAVGRGGPMPAPALPGPVEWRVDAEVCIVSVCIRRSRLDRAGRATNDLELHLGPPRFSCPPF